MLKLRLWCDTDNSPFPTSMFLALTLFITSSEDGGSSSPGGSCFWGYSLFCVLCSWCQRTLRSCCLSSTLLLSIFSGLQTEPSHSLGGGPSMAFFLSHIHHHPRDHHFHLLASHPGLPVLTHLSLCPSHLSMTHISQVTH